MLPAWRCAVRRGTLKMHMTKSRVTIIPALMVALCPASAAQSPRQLTAQDYAAAEKLMPYSANPLAYRGQVEAHWADDARYRAADDVGISYILVDPARGTRGPVFDQDKLAALLKAASKGVIKADGRH